MYFVNGYLSGNLLKYGILAHLKSQLPPIALMLVMCVCIYPISLTGMSDILTIVLQVLIEAAIYITGSMLLKIDSFHYLTGITHSLIKNK